MPFVVSSLLASITPVIIAATTTQDWITAGAIALGAILVAILIRRFTKRRIRRVDTADELILVTGRLLSIAVLTLGAFYVLQTLNVEVAPALGALGIGALFIAVGLQPLLTNVVGSVILQARRPFRRGDQVETNGYSGTVLDITSTATVLLSYNGESIHIPNGEVLANPLVNWTAEPVRRSVMPITLPYGSDLPKALATIGRATRRCLDDDNLPPAEALAIGFGAHGIETELRWWHYSEELEYRAALSQVTVAVDLALQEIGIEIPYNQIVTHRAPK